MDTSYFKGFLKGLQIWENLDRNDRLKKAHQLMIDHQPEDALEILENIRLSPSEKTAVNLSGYLLKALCYAELGYNQSALNSIKTILNMTRLSLNPSYQYVLADTKKMAREIADEYNLRIN